MNNQFKAEGAETLVEVLHLTPSSAEKHIVRNVIFQPRATTSDGVVAFKVPEKTMVEHTVHAPQVLEQNKCASTIQQELNPFSGTWEDNTD